MGNQLWTMSLLLILFALCYSAVQGSACGADHFNCTSSGTSSSTCISRVFVCDGNSDCSDGSDEIGCPTVADGASGSGDDEDDCPAGRYLCRLSRDCIPESWLCDTENDCGNWEDESVSMCGEPRNCTRSQYRCANGYCISASWECDGDNDCGDQSDEAHCANTCGHDEVVCPDPGQAVCIPTSWICDGEGDCLSGWDENNNCSTTPKPCDGPQFQCNNGLCIPNEWECDGEEDCLNGEDEQQQKCSTTAPLQCHGKFHCNSTRLCVHLNNVCDGNEDCPDGSDEVEESCNTTPVPCLYSCDDKCLTSKQLCDNQYDCSDRSDEPSVCDKNECAINNGGCSDICKDNIIGYECQCPTGYAIKGNLTCQDVDECKIYGSCSQDCFNTEGSYMCKCKPGYDLSHATNSCKAFGEPAILLFSHEESIRAVNLLNHNKSVLFDHLNGVFSLDIDYHNNVVYWFENKHKAIHRAHIGNYSSNEEIISDVEYSDGMAYDWIHHKIYWTNAKQDIIQVADRNGKNQRVIVNTTTNGTVEEPRAIAVDPFNKHIYWTDWGTVAKIEKATLHGKNRVAIITKDVWWPNGLTIDFTLNRIYWIDAKLKRIETCDLNGHHRVLVRKLSFFSHPFAISVFEEHVYWSDWETGSVEQANKFTGKDRKRIVQLEYIRPLGIKIQHQALQQPGVECFKPVQPYYNITNLHKDAYIAGRNVTIECEAGYLLVGNATITCSKHGTWKPHLPTCVPIRANCTVPTFTHHNITGARTIYYEGETFNVTCIDGFKLIGQSNLTCSNQGNWTPHVPHCTKILPKCSKPQAENYNMTLITRDDYKLGHNLTIICNQGYYPVGSTNITCSNDSSWIPALPDCLLEQKCRKPQGSQYNMTFITRDDFVVGYNLTITCNQGFQPMGNMSVVCSNDSTWIPALPDCVVGRTGVSEENISNESSDASVGIAITVVIVIVLAILVFVVGAILFFRLRKQRVTGKESLKYNADDQEVTLTNAEEPVATSLPGE